MGYVVKGSIVLQVEGTEPRTLHEGDAFYEPPHKKILKFDSEDAPAEFVAYYLLGAGERELIQML
jgi:quercetin dioxygenase-like cupin family protein